jgi:hypothetical protein
LIDKKYLIEGSFEKVILIDQYFIFKLDKEAKHVNTFYQFNQLAIRKKAAPISVINQSAALLA